MKLIFLDRDGVINHDSKDFIKNHQEWEPIPGSMDAIARLMHLGYIIIVCTNQSGIGRGIFTLEDLTNIHNKMNTTVKKHGGIIHEITFCPHTPEDQCNCRKPKPKMVLDILHKYNITDTSNIMMVGDSLKDLQTIHQVGGIPILVKTGNGLTTIDNKGLPLNTLIFNNLLTFSQFLK